MIKYNYKKTRKIVYEKYGGRCAYCGQPKFSWYDVMKAGSELEDLVFPQNHLKQEPRQITSSL